ncbi:ABC transporter permease [Spiroplasma chrysopicola]|uniref:ABC transporter permease n=1 Tax=Spiroplasma chrysopicola DF-1 TaxID=1276227 RepID=R4U2C9_9MOLU|nr:ABC transporter permease [Spiroplasma chrysopicola]AGM24603.1 ABC transporter permease [Spiroplasma chrysopicola DF-1]
MRGFKLLFKNNFRNTTKNKIQFFGLIVLVFLTSLIFTIVEVSKQRVDLVYNNFISEKMSNQHDFIVDFSETSYIQGENDPFLEITDLEKRQNAIVDYLAKSEEIKKMGLDFKYNRVEARTFNLKDNKVIKAVTLNPQQAVDKFVVANGMPLDVYAKYLESIRGETNHWTYLTPQFAKNNNIKINDIIRLQADIYGTTIKVADSEITPVDLSEFAGKDINDWLPNSNYSSTTWFRVVGFGQSADFITPIIDSTHPFPNMKDEGIAYVNPKLFGLTKEKIDVDGKTYDVDKFDLTNQVLAAESNFDREIYYAGKFNANVSMADRENLSRKLNKYLNTQASQEIALKSHYEKTLLSDEPVLTFKTDTTYKFANRTVYFTTALNGFITGSYILIALILIISFFVLILVLRRQIETTGPQNGLLRALGYRRRYIIWSYLSYPLMIALAGGALGYLLGISAQFFVKLIFGSYFNLPYTGFAFAPWALVTSVVIIFTMLLLVTIISATLMVVKKTPLELIKKEDSFSAGRIKRAVKKMFSFRNTFDSRFQAVQLSNSLGKMAGVSLTMIISTAMITGSLMIPIMLTNNIDYSYAGNNYNTLVEYNSPVYNLPTTFMKTYDPSQQPWRTADSALEKTNMTKNGDQYLIDFENGTINSENYAPTYDASEMRSLTYRNISKEFLKSNKLSVLGTDNETISNAICRSTWKDYGDYGLQSLSKKTILNFLESPTQALKYVRELEQYRLFYWKYRNTVALDIQREPYFEDNRISLDSSNSILNNNIFTKDDFAREFNQNISVINLQDNHLRPADERPLSESFLIPLQSGNADNFINEVKKPMFYLFDWIYSYFVNNVNQCFTQGVYTKAPQTIQAKIKTAFNDPTKNFNLSFGVVPFNPLTDDRGTMLEATTNNTKFKIYGIDESFKNQNLINSNNKGNLNDLLFNSGNDGIVINQTLSRTLGLKAGDTIDFAVIAKLLTKNDDKGYQVDKILNSWDASAVTGNYDDGSGKAAGTIGKMLFNEENKYKNSYIGDGQENDEVLKSTLDLNDPTSTTPTVLNQKVVSGDLLLKSNTINQSFKVVGVTNQYGAAKAWINNTRAEELLGFDQTRNYLLRLFMNEWSNSILNSAVFNLSGSYKTALEKLKEFIDSNSNQITPVSELWNKFVSTFDNADLAVDWIKVFNNEYPIFNYKTSNSKTVDDVEYGLSTIQSFGDYSFYGLNGGSRQQSGNDDVITYPSYANNAFDNLLPIAEAKKILADIILAVNSILIFIIVISFILSFMIIILTSNIIIAENRTIIATMKVLGYKNSYITKLVIGMYIPVIIIMTIAGFGFGWLGLVIGNSILTSIGLALPLILNFWIPLVAIGSGLGLYLLAYLISWFSMNKIKPLIAIMEDN